MSKGVELIAIERKRQIEELGYDYTNDFLYKGEQLALAGVCYALNEGYRGKKSEPIEDPEYSSFITAMWPWDEKFWKPTPKDRIKELTKAGALIAAQIDYELNKVK
jgi:hypothetical protein